MLSKRRLSWFTGLAAVALAMAGCGSDAEPGGAGRAASGPASSSSPSGTVVVDGSSTVFRISKAAQEAFAQVNPDVTVVVDNHGTGGGFSRYLQGEVDIVDASRAAKKDEEEKAKAQGIDWTRFVVGYDGITLVVHPDNNFVKSLTVAQLKKLWEPGSKVTTWKDLDPSWPDRKIILYSPDNDSGTFEFFNEAITGKAKLQRDGVQQSSDDNTLVSGVAGDKDGIGYFGYAYFVSNKDRLRAIPVQNGPEAKPVMPGPETIANKTYAPLSRPLFIYVKNSASRRPEVGQFLKHYLENVETVSKKAQYDPPTAEDKESNQKALAALLSPAAPGADVKSRPASK